MGDSQTEPLRSRFGPRLRSRLAGASAKGRTGRMATSWLIAGLMIGYVALCTKHRENRVDADAWEHHRAIRAITIEPWQPGNPTFARPEPSIRYSPYTIVLAAISRSTGLDPYDVLSGAAVFNTILLIAGVACSSRVSAMLRRPAPL